MSPCFWTIQHQPLAVQQVMPVGRHRIFPELASGAFTGNSKSGHSQCSRVISSEDTTGLQRVRALGRWGACLPRHRGPARAEGEVSDTGARLWHPWLRINRVLRAMLHTRSSAEAWPQARPSQEGARAQEQDPARRLVQLGYD